MLPRSALLQSAFFQIGKVGQHRGFTLFQNQLKKATMYEKQWCIYMVSIFQSIVDVINIFSINYAALVCAHMSSQQQ